MAVKVFRLDLPPERVHQLVAEFERLIAAGLAHPGIAAPLATGIDGVVAYLAQDYVAADSLDIILRAGSAPPADVLRVASHLADALDFAAAVNITHGALSPRDVLVSQDEVRVTGLGVARALERIGVAPPVRRPYTAPERTAGPAWDRRADVFSLAAMMHEMLWGRRVSGTGTQAADALTALAGGDLAALRRMFARALADDPAERFGTALAFADGLKEAFPDTPVGAPRRGSRQSTVRRRQPVEEPRLPLDEVPAAPAQVLRPAHTDDPEPAAVAQLLRPARTDEPRFQDIDLAAAVVPLPREPASTAPPTIARPPAGLMEPYQAPEVSARERSRSEIWPLALALVVGLGIGFGGGYAVGIRDWFGGEVRIKPDATTETVRLKPDTTTETVRVKPDATAETVRAKADTTAATVRPKPDTTTEKEAAGRLLIRSTPAGARVFVDGRDRGETPATVRDLGNGAHLVRLARDGYATADRRVVITASRPAQSLTIALARSRTPSPSASAKKAAIGGDASAVTIESRPSGANVFIDGKLVGTTPLSVSAVPVGDHAVRLERDGYRRWISSVRVAAAAQNRVTASLEK